MHFTFLLPAFTVLALLAIHPTQSKAELSSISIEEQAQETNYGCNLTSSGVFTIPGPWQRSNNQIDPDLEGTYVGFWRGPCLTWHTTSLQPVDNDLKIGLATLTSDTKLKAGKWRLRGEYSLGGTADRKITLSIYRDALLDKNLLKRLTLDSQAGKIDYTFDLSADTSVTLYLRSECRNFVCWGDLSNLRFMHSK